MLFREMSVTVRFIQMGTSIHCGQNAEFVSAAAGGA
jgi:hypothetical protein